MNGPTITCVQVVSHQRDTKGAAEGDPTPLDPDRGYTETQPHPLMYRLARKPDGELILQGGFRMEKYGGDPVIKIDWRDMQTVVLAIEGTNAEMA